MQLGAFTPQGNENVLSVTNTSTVTPIQLTPYGSVQPSQVLAYNAGPYDCFLAWGASSVVAVAPTAGTSKQGVTIPAGAIMVITTAPGVYYAAISGNASASLLHLTPGEGT